MRAITLFAGAIYRALSRFPRVSRLKSRYVNQIAVGGANISPSWMTRQIHVTSIATCAVVLSAPSALIAIAIQPGLPILARSIGAIFVLALSFAALSSDTAKILAIYEHQMRRGDLS